MRNTYSKKIELAKKQNINIPNDLLKKENVVGLYKFFYVNPNNKNEDFCFYIGKSTNIARRLLKAQSGHIYSFLNNDFTRLVPSKIKEYLDKGYEIRVEIKEVDYYSDSFSSAAHKLALAELQEIVKYQEIGQCLFQLPEGVGKYEKEFWNKYYRKS